MTPSKVSPSRNVRGMSNLIVTLDPTPSAKLRLSESKWLRRIRGTVPTDLRGNMSALLLSERFVAVFPSLVRALGGLPEAAIVQEIHYQLQVGGKDHDGQRWVPATAKDLSCSIGISSDAVARTCRHLRDMAVLITANPEAFQRRTWWRIDYDRLDHLAKTPNGVRESAKSQMANPPNRISESAKSTTTLEVEEGEQKPSVATGATVVTAFVERFRQVYGQDPDRQLIGRIGRDAKRMITEGKPIEQLILAAERCAEDAHGNLPSAFTKGLRTSQHHEPRGFAGIREYLEDTK